MCIAHVWYRIRNKQHISIAVRIRLYSTAATSVIAAGQFKVKSACGDSKRGHHHPGKYGDNNTYQIPGMPAHYDVAVVAAASVLAVVLVLVATTGGPAVTFSKSAHQNVRANGDSFNHNPRMRVGQIQNFPEMHKAVKTRLAVKYGKESDDQVLNFWEAPGKGRRPTIVFIHGGAWTSGDYREYQPHGFLNQGISFASVDYRRLIEAPLPGPVMDTARAVQFLRYHAEEYNIDPAKIILAGKSAGGLSALYLNYHADLANPHSADPVERMSTKPMATVVKSAQSSIDPAQVGKWGMGLHTLEHTMLHDSVGRVESGGLSEKQKGLLREFSPINHVDSHDPPVYATTAGPMHLPCTLHLARLVIVRSPPLQAAVAAVHHTNAAAPHRSRRVHSPPRIWEQIKKGR